MLFEHTLNFILSAIPACAVAITLLLALLLDKILGEARNYHYLVGFGWLAQKLEKKFNINHTKNSRQPTATRRISLGCFSITRTGNVCFML